MQTVVASIEVRSRAQAMDWSLVLISQGIDSTIEQREEDGQWLLAVAECDFARAMEAIRHYERENASVWRHELKWTGLLFDWRAVFWFLLVITIYWLGESGRPDLKILGAVDRSAVLRGEWWRLFTAVTLHADVAHLAANVSTGIVFLGLAMGCLGSGTALLASFLAGAGGNVAGVLLHEGEFRSLGASGMVMGALGLLAMHSLSFARGEKPSLWIGRSIMAAFLLLVLLGLNPKSDVVAHGGGFVSGCLLGLVMLLVQRRKHVARTFDLIAAITCAVLLVVTWALALR